MTDLYLIMFEITRRFIISLGFLFVVAESNNEDTFTRHGHETVSIVCLRNLKISCFHFNRLTLSERSVENICGRLHWTVELMIAITFKLEKDKRKIGQYHSIDSKYIPWDLRHFRLDLLCNYECSNQVPLFCWIFISFDEQKTQ